MGLLLRSLLIISILLSCVSAHAQNTGTTIRYGNSVPATCVANTGQQFSLTSGTKGMYECKATNTWTPITPVFPTGPRAINPLDYGVKMDGQVCMGTSATIVITMGSTTVSCSTASFTSADIGKRIFATNGCCLYLTSYGSGVILADTTIASITNSTTAVVAGGGAAASCTGTACELLWGTNDDTGWTAADSAWSAAGTECRVMSMPAGFSFVKLKHFNVSPSGCLTASINAVLDLSQMFVGTGMGSSVFVIEPDIDLTTCTAKYSTGVPSCYFVQQQLYLYGFSFMCGGAQLTAPMTETALVGVYAGSSMKEVGFSGCAANTNLVDGFFAHSGVRMDNIYVDGFGKTPMKADDIQGLGAENICFYCFVGDSANGATYANRYVDFGSEYGPCLGSGCVGVSVSEYYGYGVNNFQLGIGNGTNNSLFQVAGGFAILNDAFFSNASCSAADCNGLFLTNAGAVYLKNTTFTGRGAGAGINGFGASGAKVFDQGINTITNTANMSGVTFFGSLSATGTTLVTGNIALTSGWGTSAKSAISGDSHAMNFTITAAGVPGASPVLDVTYPTAFFQAPSCTLTQVGGTFSVITAPAITTTATVATITFAGTPVATQVYTFVLNCQ